MMNMYGKNRHKISYTLLRIMSKLSGIDQETRNYGTDTPLFDAEIHLIKAIKENEGISVTGLAGQMNVTKGAISQILARLDQKKMIRKENDVNNQSRLVLYLSAKGEIAYAEHEKLHRVFDNLVENILRLQPKRHRIILTEFLTELEAGIDEFRDE
jgi:DNA-binding MarR family transcriptional regulator